MPSPSYSLSQSLKTALAGIDAALPRLEAILSAPDSSESAKANARDAANALREGMLCSILAPLPHETAHAINERATFLLSTPGHAAHNNPFAAYLAALAEHASGIAPSPVGSNLNAQA